MTCLRINPNDWICRFERFITPFMRENGMINGASLRLALSLCKSGLPDVLGIPNEDFSLPDFIKHFFESLLKRGRCETL